MESINKLYAIDLAKLYYPNFLIYFIVVVSAIVVLISMFGFMYYFFFKGRKVENYKEYALNKKISIFFGALYFVAILFVITVFRFSHIWNQTVTPVLVSLVEGK